MLKKLKDFISKLENKQTFTVIYILFGLKWIYFSDAFLVYLNLNDPIYQTFKGFFYVSVTGILLYFLISRTESKFELKFNKLNTATERLENIFKSFDDIVWSVSLDFKKFYYLNDSCEIIYGYRKEEFIINPNLWMDIVYYEDKELVLKNLERVYSEGFINSVHRSINRQNQIIWVRNKAWVVYDKNNNPERIDGITVNITNEKIKELNLLKNNNYFSSIFLSNPNPIVLIDSEKLNIVSYNNVFFDTFLDTKFNLPKNNSEFINSFNTNIKEIFAKSSKFKIIESLLNLSQDKNLQEEIEHNIFEFTDKFNNIINYKINFNFLNENLKINQTNLNSSYILLTLNNVNFELNKIQNLNEKLEDYKSNFELELKNQTNNLVKLNKEKDDLISMAVHDIKNPLSSIILQTSLIKKYIEKEEIKKVEDKIYDIEITTTKITELINNLLNINRLESGNFTFYPVNVSVEDLILDEINRFKINIESKNIKVNINIISQVNANIDPYILAHIFNNIFSNALKYSNLNSEIDIELDKLNNNFVFKVKDYGQGISKGEINLIYNKFTKLSSTPTAGENSTGLGLSIVKKYIDILGGEIICESVIGEGTQFKVIIPINTLNSI